MIKISCICRNQLRLPDTAVGKPGKCPFCGRALRLVAPRYQGGEAGLAARLMVEGGPLHLGEQFIIGGPGPIGLGKMPGKDIILSGQKISRNHCRFVPAGTTWRVEDEGSRNGTCVNGVRVDGQELRDGDTIKCGEYILRFMTSAASAAAARALSGGTSIAGGTSVAGGTTLGLDQLSPDKLQRLRGAIDAVTSPQRAQPAGDQDDDDQCEFVVPLEDDEPEPPATPRGEDVFRTAAPEGKRRPEFSDDEDAPGDLGLLDDEPPPVASKKARPDEEGSLGLLDDDLYALSEGEAVEVEKPEEAKKPEPVADGLTCPACGKRFPKVIKICVACGVDLRTGKVLMTSQEHNLDAVYTATENVIGLISWLIPFGLYPVASEALGTRRPYFIWAIALITTITSVWFWAYEDSPRMMQMKNYLLWSGDGKPSARQIEARYEFTNYGDREAFEDKLAQLDPEDKPQYTISRSGRLVVKPAPSTKGKTKKLTHDEAVFIAHQSLTPQQQCFGKYQPSQLITHAFLHGDLMHLVGNLVFLLVIGSRVNALLGNVLTAGLYFLLAIAGGIGGMIATSAVPPHASLGASGAIMGLAGLYLVLLPMHNMHMVAWVRLWGLLLFRPFNFYRFTLFAIRGLWVVLFFIGLDVVSMVLRSQDGVGHGAHLGGFVTGAAIGLALLFTRLVNCRSGDLLSGILGRHAWGVIGKPDPGRKAILDYIP